MRHAKTLARVRRSLRHAAVAVFAAATLASTACGTVEPRSLDTLRVEGEAYIDPATGTPYSGPVYRTFPTDRDRVQIEGTLLDGVWDGDFTVYHPNGRTRYMGSFSAGERCGPWTENADSTNNETAYEALLDEIESLGMYPPCPESRDAP